MPASVCLWLVLTACSCAPKPGFTLKAEAAASLHRIAVLDFTDAPGADAGYSGRVVAAIVGKHVLEVEGWQVLERRRLDRILAEQDLQASDIVDPSTAVDVGRIAGVDGIIVGEVAQYRIGSIPFLFLFTLDQDLYKVGFSFRLISVETGEICLSAHVASQSFRSFEQAIAEGLSEMFAKIGPSLRRAHEHVLSE